MRSVLLTLLLAGALLGAPAVASANQSPTVVQDVQSADVVAEGVVREMWVEPVKLASGEVIPMTRLLVDVTRFHKGHATTNQVVVGLAGASSIARRGTTLLFSARAQASSLVASQGSLFVQQKDAWGRVVAAAPLDLSMADSYRSAGPTLSNPGLQQWAQAGQMTWADTVEMVRTLVEALPEEQREGKTVSGWQPKSSE